MPEDAGIRRWGLEAHRRARLANSQLAFLRQPGGSSGYVVRAGVFNQTREFIIGYGTYFARYSFSNYFLPKAIRPLLGFKPLVSRDSGLSQDLYEQINAYVFPTV